MWNRVHLDVRPYPGDDLEAEAARLRTLGAIAIDLGQSDVPWTVLADPEGNESPSSPQADPIPLHPLTTATSPDLAARPSPIWVSVLKQG